MVSVEEADKMILAQMQDFGTEYIYFEDALGRILAADIKADRDMPPYNRVAMDGIAIEYAAFEKGLRSFYIKATQAAGDMPVAIYKPEECIEIMTGAALPQPTDTVIRYEDLEIKNGKATVLIETITKGQNIHYQGKDKKQHELVATAGQIVSPALINMAASVGAQQLLVKRLPKVAIVSTGDELVEVNATPLPYQIRRSNSYTIKAVLQQYSLQADLLHIPDNPQITRQQLQQCLQEYDVIILSGGISMGKFDYVPEALEALSVEKLFHKVQQRPGKPFWFGKHINGVLVFAFPGNPVSTFMCLHRYFLPWLKASLGLSLKDTLYAQLAEAITFTPNLTYFLQVKLNSNDKGTLIATPVEGNGSGDFANLSHTDAFMELPPEPNTFMKGEAFKIWPFKQLFF